MEIHRDRFGPNPFRRPLSLVVSVSFAVIALAASLHAGIGGFGNQRAVGGVIIDATGVVRTATVEEENHLAELVRQRTAEAEGDLNEATDLRMISLKGLQQAIAKAKADQ